MADRKGPQGPSAAGTADTESAFRASSEQHGANNRVEKRSGRPNYNRIHAQPFPLSINPLPTLIPHNPLSLLHIAYVYLSQLVWRPSSLPDPKYLGYFSPETRSVHVTDPRSIRALWEHGFFGKGSLSRSEPSWLDREKRKLGLLATATSEEWTAKRREERRLFKLERARQEREAIEAALHSEADGVVKSNQVTTPAGTAARLALEERLAQQRSSTSDDSSTDPTTTESTQVIRDEEPLLVNEEHLQLTLEEAFFLTFSLGVLTITYPPSPSVAAPQPIPFPTLLPLFASHCAFPPSPLRPLTSLSPSDPFLLSYVAYHHFRSLGWVVRPGVKFGVDLLLYLRGPAFSHAEFAVIVEAAYAHEYWQEKRTEKGKGREWHWLHMVNRVQSQVRKTLVVAFIEVPPPIGAEQGQGKNEGNRETGGVDNVKRLLQRYKIREFVVKRWTPNRNRD